MNSQSDTKTEPTTQQASLKQSLRKMFNEALEAMGAKKEGIVVIAIPVKLPVVGGEVLRVYDVAQSHSNTLFETIAPLIEKNGFAGTTDISANDRVIAIQEMIAEELIENSSYDNIMTFGRSANLPSESDFASAMQGNPQLQRIKKNVEKLKKNLFPILRNSFLKRKMAELQYDGGFVVKSVVGQQPIYIGVEEEQAILNDLAQMRAVISAFDSIYSRQQNKSDLIKAIEPLFLRELKRTQEISINVM